MKTVLSLIILATSALIAQPESEVPSNMSFQGLLTDTEGIAYDDGEYQLTFRLIREMNNGTEQTVWEEMHSTNVSNGVFSVVLGSENPLPLNIPPNVLLETQVGDEILSPRQPLTSVPFALKSSRSQQAYQSVLSDTANVAHNALHATHADTAGLAMGIIGGIDIQHVEHATYADTAQYVHQAQSAINATNAEMANHATYSDTAQFVQQAQTALTANEATFANNATYSDTAIYIQQAQSALSSNESNFANNATYADTAQFVAQAQTALSASIADNSTNAVYADTATIALNSGAPSAYGNIAESGSILNGSGNFTCEWSSSNSRYYITWTDDVETHYLSGIVNINAVASYYSRVATWTSTGGGSVLLVTIFDDAGNKVQNQFNFTVFCCN